MNRASLQRQMRRFEPSTDDPYYELNSEITQLLLPFGEKLRGKTVLDFGAGERPFSAYFSRYGINVVACDMQQNQSGTIDVVLEGGGRLPFDNNYFDAVFMFDVIEHIPDDIGTLTEVARVLRGGGVLVMSIPFMYRFHEVPNDYRRYTPTGIGYVLSTAGYNSVEVKPLGSIFFVAEMLLRESSCRLDRCWKSLVRRFAIKVFSALRAPLDICPLSPFSLFVVGRKVAAIGSQRL